MSWLSEMLICPGCGKVVTPEQKYKLIGQGVMHIQCVSHTELSDRESSIIKGATDPRTPVQE